jgi:hypothetical protein
MPVPKRWHPVSRDLNQDPESWELTTLHGDRALRIWLEILAGADKTENRIPLSGLWLSSLAQLTRVNLKTLVRVILWMSDRGWIAIQGDQAIANKWLQTLRLIGQDQPKSSCKLSTDRLQTQRKLTEELTESGRRLVLVTANYWKYRKRREPTGGVDGSPPIRSEPFLLNKKKEEETLQVSEIRTITNGTRTAVPPSITQRHTIEQITGPLK